MEVDDNFNAGYGSVLTSDGEVEMDACIMDGSNMKVGAVTGVKNIFHSISLARKVMEKTKFNFLGAEGSMALAKKEGFQFLPPGTLVTQRAIDSLNKWKESQNSSLGEHVRKWKCKFKNNLYNFHYYFLRSVKVAPLAALLWIQMVIL